MSAAGPRSTTTATVLCTDLVDSTAWLGRLGEDGFDAFQRRHVDVLRSAVSAHNGREVKTLGDGTLAVFSSAAGPLLPRHGRVCCDRSGVRPERFGCGRRPRHADDLQPQR